MKKYLLSALVLISLFSHGALAEDRSIIVNGVAEKSLDPNLVHLTVEVWSRASTAKNAQTLAANQFKAIKKSFDDFKVKKEDIQTDNYSLNPDLEWNDKTRTNKVVGFRVSQALSVTLHKTDDVGNFIDSLVADKGSRDVGVNINNIAWDSDKRQQVENSALGDAVREAKEKAEEIAKAAGVKIKNVSRISHSTSGGTPPQPVYRNFAKGLSADMASTELAAGQIKVRVEVTAEYQIQ